MYRYVLFYFYLLDMINILIILMYRKNKKKYKNRYKRFFENKKDVKYYFCHWTKKNIIKYIKKLKINAIILSGSQYRILDNKKNIPNISKKIFDLNIPILGICYGYEYLIKHFGNRKCIGSFIDNKYHTYYKALKINKPFNVKKQDYILIHHDYVIKLPKDWSSIIKIKGIYHMAYNIKKNYIGIQYHPERNYKTGAIFFNNWIKYLKTII